MVTRIVVRVLKGQQDGDGLDLAGWCFVMMTVQFPATRLFFHAKC